MKNLHLLLVLLVLTQFNVNKLVSQQNNLLYGEEYSSERLTHLADVKARYLDTNYLQAAIPVDPFGNSDQHFPYPIIFIHGLASSADTWEEFYGHAISQGWSYGGQLLFNLNADNDDSYANVYAGNYIDVIDFNDNLTAADFYVINFKCSIDGSAQGEDGSNPSKSNQAAVVKQGLAVRNAIDHVMDATGKNNVILFGHSMGGLASRHYLQNPSFWQEDGQHHVAKLITSGTPHGGSNASGSIFSSIAGIDERSDAVRDLRSSYFYSSNAGVYLFGGLESPDVINDNLFGFYNYDVSCDGQSGGFVTGLNFQDIYTDLDYSSIIGDWSFSLSGGDGVVSAESAQLKNYYNITSETFMISDGTIGLPLHIKLTDYTEVNVLALDEPDYYDLAYEIDAGNVYNGFKTIQADDAEYAEDYDDYVISIPQDGWMRLWTFNNSPSVLGLGILDELDLSVVLNEEYSMGEYFSDYVFVEAGTYYVEYYANATDTDWGAPYAFQVDYREDDPTATTERLVTDEFRISPNPAEEVVNITFTNDDYHFEQVEIVSVNGQVMLQQNIGKGPLSLIRVEVNTLPPGTYIVRLVGDKYSVTDRFLKR